MYDHDWPESFEGILRRHLPLIDGRELNADVRLADLGLDSLGMVGMVMDLEESFAITIPDDLLAQETFASAASLWAVISKLQASLNMPGAIGRQAVMNWAPVLARVELTPPGYRQLVGAAYAKSILRCSQSDLDALVATCGEAPGSRLDAFDVWNIGLYSRSRRSRPELEMSYFWRTVLKRGDWLEPIRHQVTFLAACPRGAACDSDSWSYPDVHGITWLDCVLRQGEAQWAGEVEQPGTTAIISSGLIARVWHASLERYRYHYTYPALAAVVQETQRRKVGDCTALSVMLVAELLDRGFRARVRSGFLLGGMAGRIHQWAEVADYDGHWKALDLSMALIGEIFSMKDYIDFCFGSISNRVISAGESGKTAVSHRCGEDILSVKLDVANRNRSVFLTFDH